MKTLKTTDFIDSESKAQIHESKVENMNLKLRFMNLRGFVLKTYEMNMTLRFKKQLLDS